MTPSRRSRRPRCSRVPRTLLRDMVGVERRRGQAPFRGRVGMREAAAEGAAACGSDNARYGARRCDSSLPSGPSTTGFGTPRGARRRRSKAVPSATASRSRPATSLMSRDAPAAPCGTPSSARGSGRRPGRARPAAPARRAARPLHRACSARDSGRLRASSVRLCAPLPVGKIACMLTISPRASMRPPGRSEQAAPALFSATARSRQR